MKKFILAYNPVSGDAMFKKKLDDIIQQFQMRGAVIVPYRTLKDKYDPFYARCVKELEADGVIVAGGDGTLHKIINMTIHDDLGVPIGIIPSGTSNDFAVHLGIDDHSEYINNIIEGRTQFVDIGCIGDEYFINVVSAGMMTSVAHEVDARLKHTLGKLAYYLKGVTELATLKGLDFTITADEEIIRDRIFMVLVSNSPVVASFRNISPQASINDGKLDMVIIRQCNFPELMKVIADTVNGKLTDNSNVIYRQASTIHFECHDPVESDLDGELGPKLPLTITTAKDALRMFIMK